MHQKAQESAFWPSSVIRLGPHWYNSKITWANVVHALLDVQAKIFIKNPDCKSLST